MSIEIIRAGVEHSGEIATMFANLQKIHTGIDKTLFKEICDLDKIAQAIKTSIEEKTRIFLLAYLDGEPCGYLEGSLAITEDSEIFIPRKISKIENIFVYPEKRRLGCATALWNAFFSYASSRGIHHMELDVMSANNDAIKFYESLGFVPYKTTLIRKSQEGKDE